MRIILSRKGFDTSSGGFPSPILDTQPMSLPIPYPKSEQSFRDIGLEKILTDLTKNKISPDQGCHFDPNLEMGAFGQEFTSQSHLDNQGVGFGDLFLFFGVFKEAEIVDGEYRYKKGARNHHRIFGWMFINEKVRLGTETSKFCKDYPKYASHPHATGHWRENNTIYIAPNSFSLFGERDVRGFGKFRQSPQTQLTHQDAPSMSYWGVPKWLNPFEGGCIPSGHYEKNYQNGFFKTIGRGQEFVCKPKINNDFKDWLLNIFDTAM